MKKIFAILLFLFFTNCYSAETQKLTVLLDWFANPDHAPLFVAEQKGFFKAEGLDVSLIGPADPSDPPKLVAAGKADIAITYEPQFLMQVDQGLPLAFLGNLIDRPLTCLVVLKSSPIQKMSDLKNKKIGSSGGSVDTALLKIMLQHNGVNIHDVETINVHYNLTQSLLSQKVDAVTGMMRNFELIQMELAGHPGLAFFPEDNGIPSYSELIYVVNKNKLNDPRFKAFLLAVKQATDYLQKHPDECWGEFAKNHPELNNELNRRAWFLTVAYFAKNPAMIDDKKLLVFTKFMAENKLIRTK